MQIRPCRVHVLLLVSYPFRSLARLSEGHVFLLLKEFLVNVIAKSFVRYLICKYFVHRRSLSFHSFNSVFGKPEVINFNKIQVMNFASWIIVGYCILKLITRPRATSIISDVVLQPSGGSALHTRVPEFVCGWHTVWRAGVTGTEPGWVRV